MRINFRQGIVRVPPNFLQQSGSAVNLVIPTPAMATIAFADGPTDYLHAERLTVLNAWTGPFVSGTDYWLYWDINTVTGQRTFGHTLLEPIEGATAPLSPVNDQHWFDTSSNAMKVWNAAAGTWQRKIRVFAAKLASGSVFVSMSVNSPAFEGTQVGSLAVAPARAGALVFDINGDPVRRGDGLFFTTEDVAVTGIAASSQVKIGSIVVDAVATTSIPAYSVVNFVDFHQITLTTNQMADEGVYGMIEEDVVAGDVTNVVLEGVITNPLWDWSAAGVNAPVYVDALGYLTTTPPANSFAIGVVVDHNTIILQPTLQTITTTGAPVQLAVQEEGVTVNPNTTVLNFTGTAVTATNGVGGTVNVNVSAPPSLTIQEEGVNVQTAVSTLNVVGSSATVTAGGAGTAILTITGGEGDSLWEMAPHEYAVPDQMASHTMALNLASPSTATAFAYAMTGLQPGTYTFEVRINGTPFTVVGTDQTFYRVVDIVNAINTSALATFLEASITSEGDLQGIVTLTAKNPTTTTLVIVERGDNPLIASANEALNLLGYTLRPAVPYSAFPPVTANALTPIAQTPAIEEVYVPYHTYIESDPVGDGGLPFWTVRTPTFDPANNLLEHGGMTVFRPVIPFVDEALVYTAGYYTPSDATTPSGYVDIRSSVKNGGQLYDLDFYSGRFLFQAQGNYGPQATYAFGVKGIPNSTDVYVGFMVYDGSNTEVWISRYTWDLTLLVWQYQLVPSSGASGPVNPRVIPAFSVDSNTGGVVVAFPCIDASAVQPNGIHITSITSGGVEEWSSTVMFDETGPDWYYQTDVAINSADELVFISISGKTTTGIARVLAFDIFTGSPVWERTLTPSGNTTLPMITSISTSDEPGSPVYISGVYRLLGNTQPFVACLNSTTGNIVWKRTVDVGVNIVNDFADQYWVASRLTYNADDNAVYFAATVRDDTSSELWPNFWLCRFNGTSGAVVWQREFGRFHITPSAEYLTSLDRFAAALTPTDERGGMVGDIVATDTALYMSFTVYREKFNLSQTTPNIVTVALNKDSPPIDGINADGFGLLFAGRTVADPLANFPSYTATTTFEDGDIRSIFSVSSSTNMVKTDAAPVLPDDVVALAPGEEVIPPKPSLEVVNIAQVGQLKLGDLLPPPATLAGGPLDARGMLRADENAIYYCFADYGTAPIIWKRLPFETRTNIHEYSVSTRANAQHVGGVVRFTGSNLQTYTIPRDPNLTIPIGSIIAICQSGSGSVVVAPEGSVTINTPETLILRKRHAKATLIRVNETDWDLEGNLQLL